MNLLDYQNVFIKNVLRMGAVAQFFVSHGLMLASYDADDLTYIQCFTKDMENNHLAYSYDMNALRNGNITLLKQFTQEYFTNDLAAY